MNQKGFRHILLIGFILSLLAGGLFSLFWYFSDCSGESCLGRDLGIILVGPAISVLGIILSLIIAFVVRHIKNNIQ